MTTSKALSACFVFSRSVEMTLSLLLPGEDLCHLATLN